MLSDLPSMRRAEVERLEGCPVHVYPTRRGESRGLKNGPFMSTRLARNDLLGGSRVIGRRALCNELCTELCTERCTELCTDLRTELRRSQQSSFVQTAKNTKIGESVRPKKPRHNGSREAHSNNY